MGWPRAVVFDLDGTLVDSAPELARLLNKVLSECGRSEIEPARVRVAGLGLCAAVAPRRHFSIPHPRTLHGPHPDSSLDSALDSDRKTHV